MTVSDQRRTTSRQPTWLHRLTAPVRSATTAPFASARRPATSATGPRTDAWSRRGGTRSALAAVVVLLVTLAAGALAYLPLRSTTEAAPASAPAADFSGHRALSILQDVASEPRPMGSTAHEKSLSWIQAKLAAMGVESRVVEGVATRPDFNQVFGARLRNLIARIPGRDSTGSVLLTTHFNSVPTSPNTNDGGLGVATALEAIRAIKAGPPLRNDVVVWFGDADETTAMNADLMTSDPWFEKVKVGLAFEAVGMRGPSLLTYAGQGHPGTPFPDARVGETGGVQLDNPYFTTHDGRWLQEALKVLPRPAVALPLNDLALGVSPDLGMAVAGRDIGAVSFSQIADTSGYHTDLDRPDRTSPASLQVAGDDALALARHFGDIDLAAVSPTDARVVAQVAPGRLVTYPTQWAIPLAVVAVALLALGLYMGRRRRVLTVSSALLGAGLTLVTAVLAAVAAFLTTDLLSPPVQFARNPYGTGWTMLMLTTLSLTTVATMFFGTARLLRRPARAAGLSVGPALILGMLSLLTSATTPALSYVFSWPALIAGATLLVVVLRRTDAPQPVWLMLIALAATGAVVANVSVPLVYLIGSAVLLTQPVYAAVLVVLLTLLAAVLVPQLRFVAGRRLWPVPVTLAAATVVLAVLATTTNSTFTPDRPGRDSIEYLLDTDSRSATWISSGEEPDRWTRQFFKHGYARARLAFSPGYSFGQKFDVITAAAPRVALPPPELTVLRDSTEAGQRRVVFRIASQRGAPMAHLDLRLPADLRALRVQGQDVKVDPAGHVRRLPLALYNLQRGMTVSVTVHGTGALAGTLTDYSNGLPHLPGVSVSRRPESLIPAPFDLRDPTAVRTRVSF